MDEVVAPVEDENEAENVNEKTMIAFTHWEINEDQEDKDSEKNSLLVQIG